MPAPQKRSSYWAKCLRITAGLLAVWFALTFGIGFFARELDFSFFGWPFGYWVGAQGALVVYCAIVWGYAWYMNRLDQESGEADDD